MKRPNHVTGTRRDLSRRAALGSIAVASIVALAARTSPAVARTAPADLRDDAMWIPFQIDRMRLIEVDVRVNGQRARAVLDTGATRSALDQAFAKRSSISAQAGFRADGLTNTLSGGFAADTTIEIGGHRLSRLNTAVLDLSDISAALGHQVDIVLGQELFGTSLVEIDFPRNRLRLLPPGTELDLGTPLQLGASADRLRTLPVRVAGNVTVEAALDLGSNIALYIHPELAERRRLLERLRTSTAASAGAEGVEVSTVAVFPSIAIADTRLRNVPVQIPRRWRFASQALVGLPVLSRFRLGLDFSYSRAWIEPEGSLVDAPFPKDRSGLGAVPGQERLRVIHVAPGSPAERSGFVAGDEIVAVDGRVVDEAFLRERPRIGRRPAGTEVVLELANGEVRRLVLEDYF